MGKSYTFVFGKLSLRSSAGDMQSCCEPQQFHPQEVKTHVYPETCMQMFTASSSIIAKKAETSS
jgi:hypothetical protein